MQTDNISMNYGSRVPKVSICVVTYNQEKYIRQCLQSIVDQETDFDFEVLVADDCSTDGTQQVITGYANKYPNTIFPFLNKKNLGPFKNYLLVHSKCNGNYICHVDGDDQFHPHKIYNLAHYLDQKENSDCVAVVHKLAIRDRDMHLTGRHWPNSFYKSKYSIEDIISSHPCFGHSSIMYKSGSIAEIYNKSEFIDFHIYLLLASKGKIGVVDSVLGEYTQGVGISTRSSLIHLVEDAILTAQIYGVNKNQIKYSLAKQYLHFAKKSILNQEFYKFTEYIKKSIKLKIISPMQMVLWSLSAFPKLIGFVYQLKKSIK
jgi:glycosyltransferase involved in cell wall biosynthesis